jgi:ribonuclease HI
MLPNFDSYFTKKQSKVIPLKIYPEFDYILRFDGCSKQNPGLAGCGAVIYRSNIEIWADYLFVGDNVTNNYAEYSGLILGLEKAKELNITHLKVEGDSLLVINQLKGLYNCRSENLLLLYNHAKELASRFECIEFNHILRNKNKRADALSNDAVDHYMLSVI